ncbi:MAG: hypothetical protein A2847_02675 [Candidatus Sungbacteria bacterium RIFCSPHIGHO2_01_FULL_50_25]|uniref:DNA ligase n=1 Tax=Candidatus Sungbacteria bacterium RIFCSPHIGHO2_01_FULL_50_25 TaxID=1802265 RepID=A0A1G2KET4_9BACT|nr:MAG: hypothetical protein A2847_02675 [Candidatus Sungbacteria bacterium RIFCSPHIGHO2_01_FULL_50_25]
MDRRHAAERILKLRKEIDHHRYLYHVLNRSEISDEALDSLKHELVALEDEFPELVTADSPSQRVAGAVLKGFKKIRHGAAMLSLGDVFSSRELAEWESRIKKLLSRGEELDYFSELKIDGFAISLVYENGVLKSASTRGDGKVGEDVTENIKTIESVPLAIGFRDGMEQDREIRALASLYPRAVRAVKNLGRTVEIRGEVYMAKHTFDALNREQEKRGLPLFANPRNIAAGSVRQLDSKITASRRLDFLAYDIVTNLGQRTHEEEHIIAKLLGFRTDPHAKQCHDLSDVEAFWKHIFSIRDKLPFLIDGVVVQVNENAIFDKLGVVGKAPRGAVAFKFPGREATTIVEDIQVQVGRTGVLTPVAHLRPVDVGGVTVSRATLHNMDEIERLDVRAGDTVIIQRAGDVIPDVVRVLKNLRLKGLKPFHMPRVFCGEPVVRPKGEVLHKILHPDRCALVRRERFYHFVSKNAFDIQGLGPKIVDRLIDEGLVEDPADIFSLEEGDIAPLERFAEKSAENLIRSIREKKKIELPRFLFALGILHVGEETAIDLAGHFGTLEKIRAASESELSSVPNIGGVVAQSLFEWFRKKENEAFLKKLKDSGVHPKEAKVSRKPKKFAGFTFVLTGALRAMTRDEAKRRIRELGGDISGSVSRKTSVVVAGEDPGSKLDDAKRLGVKVASEKEFLSMIGE